MIKPFRFSTSALALVLATHGKESERFSHQEDAVLKDKPMPKEYKVVNGTSYDVRTPDEVIRILEDSRQNKTRLVLFYGDVEKKTIWESATPERGTVGRSTGTSPIPLLIRTERSTGGCAILDHCIVQIRESKGGRLLYKAWKD